MYLYSFISLYVSSWVCIYSGCSGLSKKLWKEPFMIAE